MTKRELRKGIIPFACKLAPVYVALNWRWGDSARPPREHEIAKELDRLIKKVTPQTFTIETGGLVVGHDAEGFFMRMNVGEELTWRKP